MALTRDYTTATIKESHYYADGTSGNDSNDGLTVSTPKKTLTALSTIIPFQIRHNTSVHLSGTFAYPDELSLTNSVDNAAVLIVDGGEDLTVVDDNTGTNYTATAASTLALTDAAASWTIGDLDGYWCKVLTGPAADQIRLIQKNTADTLTFCTAYSVSPDIGATYAIYRPTTEINGGNSSNINIIKVNKSGSGYLYIQNLYFSGNYSYMYIHNGEWIVIKDIITDAIYSNYFYNANLLFLGSTSYINADTFVSSSTTRIAGVSQRNINSQFYISSSEYIAIYNSYFRKLTLYQNQTNYIYYGTRIKGGGLILNGNNYVSFLSSSSNYSSCEIDGVSGSGVDCTNSNLILPSTTNDPIIQNCSSHGISLKNSNLILEDIIGGTGNVGAGIYMSRNSQIIVSSGITPTITGTVGDISVDGTTEIITWADIAGGSELRLVNKATIIVE